MACTLYNYSTCNLTLSPNKTAAPKECTNSLVNSNQLAKKIKTAKLNKLHINAAIRAAQGTVAIKNTQLVLSLLTHV